MQALLASLDLAVPLTEVPLFSVLFGALWSVAFRADAGFLLDLGLVAALARHLTVLRAGTEGVVADRPAGAFSARASGAGICCV